MMTNEQYRAYVEEYRRKMGMFSRTHEEVVALRAELAKVDTEASGKYKISFAPSDGICWRCHRSIFGEGGYSREYAAAHSITGCPHCHRSFVD